ncbi:Protein of unknown function [Gryllus bimaculatus]|nr:Protein of unknown function [Gryllus bimaculatus]
MSRHTEPAANAAARAADGPAARGGAGAGQAGKRVTMGGASWLEFRLAARPGWPGELRGLRGPATLDQLPAAEAGLPLADPPGGGVRGGGGGRGGRGDGEEDEVESVAVDQPRKRGEDEKENEIGERLRASQVKPRVANGRLKHWEELRNL